MDQVEYEFHFLTKTGREKSEFSTKNGEQNKLIRRDIKPQWCILKAIGSFLRPIGTVDPSLGSRIFIGSTKRLGLAFIMRTRVHDDEETAS